MDASPTPTARPESQADRCSLQHHLWRRSETFGFTHMACRCGAVHPNDLAEFQRAASEWAT